MANSGEKLWGLTVALADCLQLLADHHRTASKRYSHTRTHRRASFSFWLACGDCVSWRASMTCACACRRRRQCTSTHDYQTSESSQTRVCYAPVRGLQALPTGLARCELCATTLSAPPLPGRPPTPVAPTTPTCAEWPPMPPGASAPTRMRHIAPPAACPGCPHPLVLHKPIGQLHYLRPPCSDVWEFRPSRAARKPEFRVSASVCVNAGRAPQIEMARRPTLAVNSMATRVLLAPAPGRAAPMDRRS